VGTLDTIIADDFSNDANIQSCLLFNPTTTQNEDENKDEIISETTSSKFDFSIHNICGDGIPDNWMGLGFPNLILVGLKNDHISFF